MVNIPKTETQHMSSKQEIVNYLSSNPESTATSIAKGLMGKSKASQGDKNLLEEMVGDGLIEEDCSGRYVTYTAVDGAEVAEISGDDSDAADLNEAGSPATRSFSGVEVSEGDDGGFEVFLPGESHPYLLGADEHLLIINGKPEFTVTSPGDVLEGIEEYTRRSGIQTFTITDVVTNKQISGRDDISLGEGRIISLNVNKHNKAATA